MRRICFFLEDLSRMSGMIRVICDLANAMAEKNQVFIFTLCSENGGSAFPLSSQVEVYSMGKAVDKHKRELLVPTVRELRRFVKEKQIDILLCMGMGSFYLAYLGTVFTHTKVVACEHSNLNNRFNSGREQRLNQRFAAKHADRVVTLTKRDQEAYQQTFGLPDGRAEYIYNPIDSEWIASPAAYDGSSRKILSVGRFSPEKGYDLLIQVAEIVLKAHPDWQWDIYGDGPLWKDILCQVKGAGLDNLHLPGQVEDLDKRYPQYGLFVLTSYHEGLPMVLLEAQANGLPIVSFDCITGPQEIVKDQINGYLIAPFEVEEMARAICRLIESADLRVSFSQHAKDDLKKFSMGSVMARWEDLFDALDSKQRQ